MFSAHNFRELLLGHDVVPRGYIDEDAHENKEKRLVLRATSWGAPVDPCNERSPSASLPLDSLNIASDAEIASFLQMSAAELCKQPVRIGGNLLGSQQEGGVLVRLKERVGFCLRARTGFAAYASGKDC